MPFRNYNTKGLGDFLSRNIVINYKFIYRYVIHNSMLEGYGIFKHNLDEDPTSPIDRWYLREYQMERNILINELTVNIKFRYCGIVFKQTIMSPEFDLPVNSWVYPYGEGNQPGNHNRSPWNHYGTIGLIFKL